MRTIWVAYDKSDKRLPIAFADTAQELARICGVTLGTVTSTAYRYRKKGRKRTEALFARVEVDDDAESGTLEIGTVPKP